MFNLPFECKGEDLYRLASDFGEIKHIIYKINKTLFLFKRMDKWKWLSGGGGVNGLRDKNNKSG